MQGRKNGVALAASEVEKGREQIAAPVYGRVFQNDSKAPSPEVAYRTMEKQTMGRERMYCRLRVWWKRMKDSNAVVGMAVAVQKLFVSGLWNRTTAAVNRWAPVETSSISKTTESKPSSMVCSPLNPPTD